MLEDETGFVKRDFDFIIPPQDQVLGPLTPSGENTWDYVLHLPSLPPGVLVDVANKRRVRARLRRDGQRHTAGIVAGVVCPVHARRPGVAHRHGDLGYVSEHQGSEFVVDDGVAARILRGPHVQRREDHHCW